MRDIDIIPIKEASILCGVSQESLELLNRAGELKYKKHPYGGYKTYSREKLERFFGVPKNSFLPQPSDKELINAARMCFENSSKLLEDAKLLYSEESFASSFSICALSLEELSKSVSCLDPISEAGRDKFSWKKFWDEFFSHSIKIERIYLYRLIGLILSGNQVKEEFKKIKSFSWYVNMQKQNGFYVDYVKSPEKARFDSPKNMVGKPAAEEIINLTQVSLDTIEQQSLLGDEMINKIRNMTLDMIIKKMSTPELKKLIINLNKSLI